MAYRVRPAEPAAAAAFDYLSDPSWRLARLGGFLAAAEDGSLALRVGDQLRTELTGIRRLQTEPAEKLGLAQEWLAGEGLLEHADAYLAMRAASYQRVEDFLTKGEWRIDDQVVGNGPRDPILPGDVPTLGYYAADFIEASCAIPDGARAGAPYLLTSSMWRFDLRWYSLQPDGVFRYRRGQLTRPQKWGKGPFLSSIICNEAVGPAVPMGWDEHGWPIAAPWPTPWIQVVAASEGQTDNVWLALLPMIQLGPLDELIPDALNTRIKLPNGGLIEPVTASALSRLGQRLTFGGHDETHSWTRLNGGQKLADTQRRNLGGMGGRSIETTNAWDPAEESVAQDTYENAPDDVLRDYTEPPPGSMANRVDRRRILKGAYGDVAQGVLSGEAGDVEGWVGLDRIDADVVELLARDPAQAERFFGNRIVALGDAYFDLDLFKAIARDGLNGRPGPPEMAPDDPYAGGFDGSRFDDSTGIILTHIPTGYQFLHDLWERPATLPVDAPWEVDVQEVDASMERAFDELNIIRFYADPYWWEGEVADWAGRWPKKVYPWWTNRDKAMAYCLKSWTTAMRAGETSHDGNPAFIRHVGNSRKRLTKIRDEQGALMSTIQKDRRGSKNKIDLAICGGVSWEATCDAKEKDRILRKRKRTGRAVHA